MAPIADTDRLVELLRDLHREGRTERRWDVWFTEYGYETRPPDPFQLYTPAQQARFMGWSTYLAWKTPGVRSHAQFLLPQPRRSHADERANGGLRRRSRGAAQLAYLRRLRGGLGAHPGRWARARGRGKAAVLGARALRATAQPPVIPGQPMTRSPGQRACLRAR